MVCKNHTPCCVVPCQPLPKPVLLHLCSSHSWSCQWTVPRQTPAFLSVRLSRAGAVPHPAVAARGNQPHTAQLWLSGRTCSGWSMVLQTDGLILFFNLPAGSIAIVAQLEGYTASNLLASGRFI